MKNRILLSFVYVVLGVLLILIPKVILPTCDSSTMKMACYYSGQVEVGLGLLVILLSALALLFANKDVRAGISIAQLGIGILVLVYPLKLIGLCKMNTMMCRSQTLPGLIVTSVLLIVISAFNIVYLAYFAADRRVAKAGKIADRDTTAQHEEATS